MDNNFKLSNQEQACLLLIKEGLSLIPKDIFTDTVKSRLLGLKLVQLDDNKETSWTITHLGIKAIDQKVAIKYPLHAKLTNYNNVINTMTDSAKNALLCSQMNNHFFDDIPVPTLRVLIQSFIDKGLYRKFGNELTLKLIDTLSNDKL